MLAPREIPRIRKRLAFDSLLRHVLRPRARQLPDARKRNGDYTVADAVLSALAMFSLKDPSLLAFQNRRNDQNMKNLYRIENVPSDTQMRDILDPVQPDLLRPLFSDVFHELQRGKALEPFVFYEGSYLLSLDGTEYFSSQKIHCPCCLQRKHKNGQVTYYHQMLGVAMVHPDQRTVIPFAPEPIVQQDGQTKNDCERNASKRLLEKIRREHPKLNLTVVEDGLASNAPHIRLLKKLKFHFILGAKPDDHQYLFAEVERASREGRLTTLHWTEPGKGSQAAVRCELRFVNEVPLNQSNEDLLVNFLQYTEYDAQGRVLKRFSWVTDFTITEENAELLMRGGRSRWKIENETFNTLKNQGYHFEHNYGHGKQHLSVVLAMLMMLAFLLDQLQAFCCPLFQAVRAKFSSLRLVWDYMRSHFRHFDFVSMEHLYEVILRDGAKGIPAPCFGRRYVHEDAW
jgi:hypothetical protein